MSDNAQLILRRKRAYIDKVRAYKVILDGEQVGVIREGEELVLPVHPGPHEVRLKIDWCSSQPLSLLVSAGDTIQLSCGPGVNMVTALWSIAFDWSRYLRLERAAPQSIGSV